MRVRARINRSRSAVERLPNEKPRRESVGAIRSKIRFWRAPMRRQGGEHENFFIAKNGDSESARRAFGRYRLVARTSIAHRSFN
jgi:hypothetical protein